MMTMAHWGLPTPNTYHERPDPRTVVWRCQHCSIAVQQAKFRFCRPCSYLLQPVRSCPNCNRNCRGRQCTDCHVRQNRGKLCVTQGCTGWKQRPTDRCRRCNKHKRVRSPRSPEHHRHRDRSPAHRRRYRQSDPEDGELKFERWQPDEDHTPEFELAVNLDRKASELQGLIDSD